MSAASPDVLEIWLACIDDETAALPSRLEALSHLAQALHHYPESFVIARCVIRLLAVAQTSTQLTVLTHLAGVFGRLKSVAAADWLINVCLGDGIAAFDGPTGKTALTSDGGQRLRTAAARALGQLQDERAVMPLMSLLTDRSLNYRLRLAAAESLGHAGDPHALGSLMDILEDDRESSIYLKESAAKALGMLGDIRAMDSLLHVLESKRGIKDKFDFLKERAIEAIGRLIQPEQTSADDKHRKIVDNLRYALLDNAPSIRIAAIEAFVELNELDHLPLLIERLRDSHEEVALAAVPAIFQLGGEEAIQALLTRDDLPTFIRDEMETYIP